MVVTPISCVIFMNIIFVFLEGKGKGGYHIIVTFENGDHRYQYHFRCNCHILFTLLIATLGNDACYAPHNLLLFL